MHCVRKSLFYGILFLVVLCLTVVSCAQPVDGSKLPSSLTLQELSHSRSSLVAWSSELEQASSGSEKKIAVSPSVALTPQTIVAVEQEAKPVFPSLPGFTTLDTSALDGQTLYLLKAFCENMEGTKSRWNSSESFMQADRAYALVVFLYDFENLALSYGLNPASSSVVQSYYLGTPFVSDTIVQCPVRLVFSDSESHTADILVWLSKENATVKISRLTWL